MSANTAVGPQNRTGQVDGIRDVYRAAHAIASVDLQTTPWLTVIDQAGRTRQVGLREMLENAHHLADIGEPEPLARAAVRRWLTALAIRLVHLAGSTDDVADWTKRVNDNSGFQQQQIDALLEDQANYLHLYHPHTPFLQDIRFVDGRPFHSSWQVSSDELLPQAPGDSARAWAVKAGDPGYRHGVDAPSAAVALVRRWFYGLLGNGGGGDMGAAFPNGTADAPITHIFRVAPDSLFASVLRNIDQGAVRQAQGGLVAGPAWMDATRPREHGDGLYRYTTTATSCLVAGAVPVGRIDTVLRGSIDDPPGSKKRRHAAKVAAKESDPHRVRRALTPAGKVQSDVRVSAAEPPLRRLNTLRRGVLAESTVVGRGVVNNADLWLPSTNTRDDESLELLLASLAGSATSPQWSATATTTFPAVHLDPEWEHAGDLDVLLDAGFGEGGVFQQLRRAVSGVFRETLRGRPVGTAVAWQAQLQWLSAAEDITNNALRGGIDDTEAVAEFWSAAIEAASTVLAPYAATSSHAGAVVKAIVRLRQHAHMKGI